MEAFLPFYGRRKGRPLRNTSKRLLEELLPAYVVPDNASDPAKLFTHKMYEQKRFTKITLRWCILTRSSDLWKFVHRRISLSDQVRQSHSWVNDSQAR